MGEPAEKRFGRAFFQENWPAMGIVLLVLGVYGRAVGFEFLNWDDHAYILQNPLLRELSWGNTKALLTPGAMKGEALYIPLSYISFLPNSLLLGLRPDVAHGLNVLLHAANSVLVFLVIRRLARSGYAAVVGALLFALHPVQVETVAWVFSRRELLAGTLALFSILLFMRSLDTDRLLYGWLALAAFVLGGLAKPSVILLPLALLAIGLLISGTRRWLRTILPPFWIAAAAMLILNTLSTKEEGLSFFAKMFQLAWLPELTRGWLARLFLIEPLNPFYLRSTLAPETIAFGPLVLVLTLIGGIYVLWRIREWAMLTWVAIAVALAAPSMSIFLFANRMFYTADHYAYLPMLGFAGLLGALAGRLADDDRRAWSSTVSQIAAASVLGLCSVAALRQCANWRNSGALHQYALSLNPRNPIAHTLLGNWYLRAGNKQAAEIEYRRAVDARIAHVNAWQNLAALRTTPEQSRRYLIAKYEWDYIAYLGASRLKAAGKPGQALAFMRRRIEQGGLRLDCPDFLFRFAQLNHIAGNMKTAATAYRRTLDLTPEKSAAAYNLGMIKLTRGQSAAAVVLFRQALKFGDRNDPETYASLGAALYGAGETAEAIKVLEQSLALNPGQAAVHELLARGYLRTGSRENARKHAVAAKAGGIKLSPELQTLLK